MTCDELGKGKHSISDVVTLLAAIGLAVAIWACLGGDAQVAEWKAWVSASSALLLALAALTRHPGWEIRLRLVAGAWFLAAPWTLGFGQVPPILWAHLGCAMVILAAAALRLVSARSVQAWRYPAFAPGVVTAESQVQ
jgi:hypothetical protein